MLSIFIPLLATLTTALAIPIAKDQDRACAPLEVLYARGTGEAQGLGLMGAPLSQQIAQLVSGATTYAVVYPASQDLATSIAAGSTNVESHITSTAASCPETLFALAGWSQGAMVMHDVSLSSALAAKVVAIAVYGDPYYGSNDWPISDTSDVFSACATTDDICGGGGTQWAGGHASYASNGAVAASAEFIADRV